MRGMSNALGSFHQHILGSVDGWVNHDAGYDLEATSHKVISEVKNKWNTMNSSNRRSVIGDLKTALRQKQRGWKAYLVHVIPKQPERYVLDLGEGVYETDGATFYHIVTGHKNAIHDLMGYLCDALISSKEIADYCRDVMAKSLPPRK